MGRHFQVLPRHGQFAVGTLNAHVRAPELDVLHVVLGFVENNFTQVASPRPGTLILNMRPQLKNIHYFVAHSALLSFLFGWQFVILHLDFLDGVGRFRS